MYTRFSFGYLRLQLLNLLRFDPGAAHHPESSASRRVLPPRIIAERWSKSEPDRSSQPNSRCRGAATTRRARRHPPAHRTRACSAPNRIDNFADTGGNRLAKPGATRYRTPVNMSRAVSTLRRISDADGWSRKPKLAVFAAAAAIAVPRASAAQGAPDRAPISRSPEPGRVPVIVESTGAPQAVRVARSADASQVEIAATPPICSTPCTLYAQVGTITLHASADGLLAHTASLAVPPSGLRVRFRAVPSGRREVGAQLVAWGGALFVAGFALAVPFLVLPPRSPADQTLYRGLAASGITLGGLGAVMLVVGAIVAATSPAPGVVVSTAPATGASAATTRARLRARPWSRVLMGAQLSWDGAQLVGGVRF